MLKGRTISLGRVRTKTGLANHICNLHLLARLRCPRARQALTATERVGSIPPNNEVATPRTFRFTAGYHRPNQLRLVLTFRSSPGQLVKVLNYGAREPRVNQPNCTHMIHCERVRIDAGHGGTRGLVRSRPTLMVREHSFLPSTHN